MSPDLAPLFPVAADAAKVDSLLRDHGRDHPLHHEAKLAAKAIFFEAAIRHESERHPVCTRRVEEYRALLAMNQYVRDAYRRKHVPGGSHDLLIPCLLTPCQKLPV